MKTKTTTKTWKWLGSAMFLLLIATGPAVAGTITVSTKKDNDTAPNDCTLRNAVQAAFEDKKIGNCAAGSGADTINVGGVGGVIKLPLGSINLSSSLTIVGPATISDAAGQPIFVLASSNKIELKDLDFFKGSTSGSGGALLVNGGDPDVTIDNCTFTENQASSEGGAIWTGGGKLTIKKSYFALNTAGQSGGAVKASGTVIIEDSWFEDNVAGFGGGAVLCGNGFLTLKRSYFDLNIASGDPLGQNLGGGGVHSQCGTDILHSHFYANHTFGNTLGGGLYLGSSGAGYIDQSVFELNSSGFGSGSGLGEGGGGGGLFLQGLTIINRSVITKNYVKGGFGGGGIHIFGPPAFNKPTQVINSVVYGNYSLEKDEVPVGDVATECSDPNFCRGAGISVVTKSKVELIATTIAKNHGVEELFANDDVEVVLLNTAIEGEYTDRTCGGQLADIINGDTPEGGGNMQWAGLIGDPSCELVPKGDLQLKVISGGSFPAATPNGPLEFSYPWPKITSAAKGAGYSAYCKVSPINQIDLLAKPRPDKCTVGAVETP